MNKKTKNYKIRQYKIKKLDTIKKFIIFFPIYKNVRENKKELL